MRISSFVQSIKSELQKKQALIDERKEIRGRIKGGEDFFLRAVTEPKPPAVLAEAAKIMADLARQLTEIDGKIYDIDVMTVTKLETYLSDFVVKATIPDKTNEAGDMIPKTDIAFVAELIDNEEYTEVEPDDIWFLKLIKQALNINNIQVFRKSDYYKK